MSSQDPYASKLKALRKQYRKADQQSHAKIVHAGRAIRRMQAACPKDAVAHLSRVVRVCGGVG
jgi:hypothetical protein